MSSYKPALKCKCGVAMPRNRRMPDDSRDYATGRRWRALDTSLLSKLGISHQLV
jgi:hypothetical protein